MKRPLVAIIGRPNVGKSTLFNRILRRKEAIVDGTPGVTRDRKQAAVDWSGAYFDLLDTGGFVPGSEDVFEKAILEQIDLALAEAVAIIFVIDVIAGVTPIDLEISSRLRRSGLPVALAVNKVDNERRELQLSEFYQLGLGIPHPVSALSGRGMGDFLDAVLEILPRTRGEEELEQATRLAVVGRPNVGKSSYINALLGQDKLIVTEIPGTTRDAIDTRIIYYKRPLILVDTAGLRKRARVTQNLEYYSTVRTFKALKQCDVAMIMIDAAEGLTDQDKKIVQSAIRDGVGVVLGVNKWDLLKVDSATARRMEVEIRESVRDLAYAPIVFISALRRQRIFRLLDNALKVADDRNRRLSTAELNDFLEQALVKHHPPAFGDRHVKINYATQVRVRPPLFIFFTNEPKGIKTSYKNYLENQFRERFGFHGVPLRFQFRKKN